MHSPGNEHEEPSSSTSVVNEKAGKSGTECASSEPRRPPAKRRLSTTVIEISDTESDDSDVCAVNSYQATADEVKRIRGTDYSSSSSSSEYSSDSESPWEDDSIVVGDIKIDSSPIKAQLNPRANRMDDPKFNPALRSQELIERLSTHWTELKDHSNDEVTLTCDPFRVCLVKNFLANPEIINNIVDDMNTLDWSRKKMDLFEFHQTTDLASLTWQRSIRGIYELLKTEVMSWVSEVTGLELTSVSASCSLYGPGDHLLVHDDLLADRRVAFIFYLAPWTPRAPPARHALENGSGDHDKQDAGPRGWSESMGGALELLARDGRGPTHVVRRVLPRNNMLAFFRVGPDSFHQVGEVMSLELPRLSINGWFHGPAPPDLPSPPDAPLPQDPPFKPHSQVVLLNQWVEATYLSPRSRAQVQAQMERDSEVCLRDLLLPHVYAGLLRALRDPDVPWESCGPAHQRRYERVSPAWLAEPACAAGAAGAAGAAAAAGATGAAGAAVSAGAAGAATEGGAEAEHPVRGVVRMFSSATWARLLADCTDLQLAAASRLELQRWVPGDFTLLPPRTQYARARLEAVLYLGAGERAACGGATVYVAPEDADGGALVTLPPAPNTLNLVYCDAGAASFTKYVGRLAASAPPPTEPGAPAPAPLFYILTCTYSE